MSNKRRKFKGVPSPGANPSMMRAVQELRQSGAASTHEDRRTKRRRTRATAEAAAIAEQTIAEQTIAEQD